MEYALHEIGLGGCAAIQKYWTQGVQDYAVRLDQEDMEMIQDYKSFLVSYYICLVTFCSFFFITTSGS